MKNVIRSFIKYPVVGSVLLVAIFMFGWVGFSSMKTTFFPLIPSKTIIIQAFYPGASPGEIEEAIVLKIENNLKGLTGVERVESVSGEDYCMINITVLTDYDVNEVLLDVKNAVNKVSSFPTAMERLTIYRQEMRNFAIDFVLAGKVTLLELKKEARRIELDLLAIDGISKVSLSGFPEEEIEVAVKETDLRAYGLTFGQVAQALREANIRSTGGKIKGPREELLIRANVKGYYAEELANHVLKSTADGDIVRLKDVATLTDRWSENPNRVYYNNQPAVRVIVQNTNEEDLFQVTEKVKEYVEAFNQKDSPITAFVLRDGSEIIQERIDILAGNGILGMFLVLLLLSMTLNIRMSFWVALAIPVSYAGMTMVAPFYGLTINVMSLMAMILVLGILVDDGIVIAENIYQHHERGVKPIPAAVNGTIEVLPSVTASILTTVVIFSSFFFLEGGLGDRSRDLAFVVVATLLISLVEATFILPSHLAHSRALCKSAQEKNRVEKRAEKIFFAIRDRMYRPVLNFSVQHPLLVISLAFAVFLVTLGALRGGIIKTTYFPVIERRSVDVVLEMPAGTPDTITDALLSGIEEKTWTVNEKYRQETGSGQDLILSISRQIGPGTHQGNLSVTLVGSEQRQWDSMRSTNEIRDAVGPVPGAKKLEFGGRGWWGKPISIALASNNLEQLRDAKDELKSELRKLEKLKDVVDNDPPGLREIKISLKQRAFALGLTTGEVVSQVRSGFFGNLAQRILRGIDEVKIWVRYDRSSRQSVSQLEDMRIRTATGGEYPLGEIADLSIKRGIMSINHINGQRVITVEADISDPKDSVPVILSDLKEKILADIGEKYPDIQFLYEGQSRENKKTMVAISRVIPPILILVFLIIVVNFRSFTQALVVILLIPFSIIGVLWGHFIQGFIVSMLSWFGTIALAGIVVNNSLVLVSTLNRKLKEGVSFEKALLQTGISRFRPVVLTSLTTIAGLGPLIFSHSHQSQFLSPMAVSVAYGLLFGTMLTLVMLPSMLVTLNAFRMRFYSLLNGKKISPEEAEPAVREEKFVRSYSGDCKEE